MASNMSLTETESGQEISAVLQRWTMWNLPKDISNVLSYSKTEKYTRGTVLLATDLQFEKGMEEVLQAACMYRAKAC